MEAAKQKHPAKAVAPQFLQTIDDPYFDEDGPLSPGANFGIRRASRVSSPLAAPTKLPADPLGLKTGAKAVARTRELQYALRAKQRRLNLLIGVVVFVFTLSVLLFIGVAVFSRPQRDTVTATFPDIENADVNRTHLFDDSGLVRRLHMKRGATRVEEDRDLYEVAATVAVDAKSTGKKNGHLHYPRKRPHFSPRAIAVENDQLAAGVGGVEEPSVANARPEKLRNSSLYRLLKRGSGNSLPFSDCSLACKRKLAPLMDELNQGYSPCESLYHHVCSNWQTRYASLADKTGSYSVDNSILDKFRAQIAQHLLTFEEATFRESRQLFRDCANGTLLSKEEIQHLLGHFQLDRTSSSVEAVAETVVRLSRLGVSPFFDVIVNKKGNDFSVTLRPPTSSDEEIQDADVLNEKRAGWYRRAGNKSATTATKAFIHAIERHLCYAVIGDSNPGAHCFLTPDSATLPSWNYEWYKSTGLEHLAFHAASIFWPLFFASETGDSSFESNLESSDYPAHVEGCLRLIERYDPDLLVHSALSITGTSFEQLGRLVMDSITKILGQKVSHVPRISIKFSLPARGSQQLNESTSTGNAHGSFNRSRLERYLVASTWKRWTQGIDRYNVLSAAPVLLNDTLYVPLSMFDPTSAVEDSWLWYMSLFSRVAPRFLKPILLSIPEKVLNEAQLIRCLRNTSATSDGARSKTNFPGLDVVEVASVAYSLEAFRSHITRNAVVTERDVSIEGLFLYHYVFNKCTAVPSGEAERSNSVARLSRLEVDSVSHALGSSLLHDCATNPGVDACYLGNK